MQLCAKFCYGPFEGEKFHLQLQKKAEYSNYGNTGCQVFKWGGRYKIRKIEFSELCLIHVMVKIWYQFW